MALGQEVVVQAVAVLNAQDERDAGVANQVLPDVEGIHDLVGLVSLQLVGGPDVAEHEQLDTLGDALGHDGLVDGIDGQALGEGAGQDGDVGLDLHEGVVAGA